MPHQRVHLVVATARFVYESFRRYDDDFRRITRRAPARFLERDRDGARADLVERMELWERSIARAATTLGERLGARLHDRTLWHLVKEVYGVRVASFRDAEFARTFFTSVTRRLFDTVGVDPLIEFVLDLEPERHGEGKPPTRVHVVWDSIEESVANALREATLGAPFEDIERDAALARAEIERLSRREYRGPDTILRLELITTVFYQSANAYLVGRIDGEGWCAPFAIGIRHDAGGLALDGVYMTDEGMSILLGYTRSYFFVDLDDVRGAVHFLKELLPDKPVDELYTVLGRVRQGKTERYRHLVRHVRRSRDRFVPAPGDRGMVMIVFTLPSHHLVFKVIRDRFGHTKTVTRRDVVDRYRLVSRHDRVGRLIDAQAYRHLEFPADWFDPTLLEELVESAARTVRLTGERVAIDHLYMERRLRPLNLYLREASRLRAEQAVLDYGQTIRDLAATNIFPGDMLLKNFGVTRHGRIIFYDFDEITLLGRCRFRALPSARSEELELADETWFEVEDGDVFPEQFEHFLGMAPELKRLFLRHHGELLTPAWWHEQQRRLRAAPGAGADPEQPLAKSRSSG